MPDKEPINQNQKTTLISVELDPDSITRTTRDIDHERKIAIYDLLRENYFTLPDHDVGPYTLLIAMEGSRLVLHIGDRDKNPITSIILALGPFRSMINQYFMICDSYYESIKMATPNRIETIDMARRALHNEGAELLQERLKGKVKCDNLTARRLFTLICALHWKGRCS